MEKSKFQFKNQKIVQVEFSVNNNFDRSHNEVQLEISMKEKHKKTSTYQALSELEISVFKKEFNPQIPFYIRIIVEGEFKWEENIDNSEQLLKINAPALLLSYARSMITQLTVFAGFEPLIIPLVDFTKNPDNETIKS